MALLNMVEAINQALLQELERDDRIILLGEDVGKAGGVFRATDNLQTRFGEDRVVDTPLAESAIVGASIGLAARGLRPVAEIQFLGFIYEAMDQLATQAARMRARTAGKISLPMVIRSIYGGGVRTPEMHSDSLEGLFVHSSGIKVVMPSTPYDAKGLLIAAIRDPDPVLFLEPMKLYRAFKEEVPEDPYTIEIGKAKVLTEGDALTLITWGAAAPVALAAANAWQERHGDHIEVLDLRTVVPMDEAAIISSVNKTGRVLIVHEAVKSGGAGAEVAALISEKGVMSLLAPILRVTGYDTPYPAFSLEDDWLPNQQRITQAIQELLSYR